MCLTLAIVCALSSVVAEGPQRPRVAVFLSGEAGEQAEAIGKALPGELGETGHVAETASLAEVHHLCLAPFGCRKALARARKQSVAFALFLQVQGAKNDLRATVNFIELPGRSRLLSEQYEETNVARMTADIARDLKPFLTGVTTERLPQILSGLSSGNDDRAAVGRAELRAMRGEALPLTLLEAFTETENEVARVALAGKLARLGDPAPLPEFRAALSGAAVSAGDEGGATAESGLRCRLGTPFCELAGQARDRESAAAIAKLLVAEQERAVGLQKTAEGAERRLGPDMVTLTPEERARAKKQADYYSELLSESKEFQSAAIHALGRIAVPETARALLDTVLINSYADAARRALVEMGSAASKTLLASVRDEQLATDCVRLLGEIRDAGTVAALAAELPKTDPFIQQLIVEALGKIGEVEAAPPVRRYLDDPYLGRAAALALGRMKDARSVPRLVQLLSSRSLRETAAEALALTGNEEAIQALLSALRAAGAVEERKLFVRALGKSGSGRVAVELLRYVRDADVREDAAQAICELGLNAEKSLLGALAADDWGTRRNAIYLLGLVGAASSSEKLQQIANGKDADSSFMARAAISKLEERSRLVGADE